MKTEKQQTGARYIVYTVGGWYRSSGHNEQTMFATDAERVTWAKAQRIVAEKELWQSDIEPA